MRLLLINDLARFGNGGGNRVVVETLEGLSARGMSVGCIHHSGESELSTGIWTRRVTDRQPVNAMRHQMQKAIHEFQPDIIHSHSNQILASYPDWMPHFPMAQFVHDESWFCSAGNRVDRHFNHCQRPHGLGCLWRHYGIGCGGISPKGNLTRWRLVGPRMAAMRLPGFRVHVASQFMRRGFLENGFDPQRIAVIPLYSAPPRAVFPVDPGLVVTPSRLVPHKGIATLIQALNQVKSTPWRLIVPGDGPERPRLESLVRELGLGKKVQFPGELRPEEVDAWYARAQVVAFPVLRAEPFGLVGVEALAHGKPIIAFSGGAVEEWLWPGETGIQVEDKTPEALGHALKELLGNPDRCREMGEAAKQRAAHFTLNAYLDRLLIELERVRDQFIPSHR